MSREIKFRIWDGQKNEWLGASDNDVLTYYGFHLVGEVMTVQAPPQWALDPHCVVEQYTGLKDKNGKEIYEGDIFRNTINGGTWRVNWDENDAAFWVDSGVTGCGLGEFNYDRSEREYGFIRKNCEIIGNVHENSELLGEAKSKGGLTK